MIYFFSVVRLFVLPLFVLLCWAHCFNIIKIVTFKQLARWNHGMCTQSQLFQMCACNNYKKSIELVGINYESYMQYYCVTQLFEKKKKNLRHTTVYIPLMLCAYVFCVRFSWFFFHKHFKSVNDIWLTSLSLFWCCFYCFCALLFSNRTKRCLIG